MRDDTLMKYTLFSILFLAVFSISADEKLYVDNFTSPLWRIVNTQKYAKVSNRTMILPDDKPYFRTVPKLCPFGTRVRFTIEKTDAGKYRMGFIIYPEEKGKKIQRLLSPEQSGKGSFTIKVPLRARNIALFIHGAGSYKRAEAVRLVDNAYRLEAEPQYQLVSDKAAPFTFKLYHNNKLVPDAKIRQSGADACHPGSGATAHAFVDKGDPSAFDKIAKDIKIKTPVNILYLGDSLTHFDIGRNHADKVGFFLNKFNPGKVRIWNYACGGDYIQRILNRMDGKGFRPGENRYHDLWSRNYDWAIIFLGHNDTKASSAKGYKEPLMSPAKQKELYLKLISILRRKGIKRIILFSSTSSNFEVCKQNAAKSKKTHNLFGIPEHMEKFNQVLQTLAKENKLEYLDLYTEMKAMPDKAALTRPNDGVHLTDRGHDHVALKTLKFFRDSQK